MRIHAAFCLAIAVLAAPAADLSGTWQGIIVTPRATLHMGLTVTKAAVGYAATIDSYDQGGYGIPVATVKIEGLQLHLEISSINAVYDATLSADAKTLTGKWTQRGHSIALNFTRGPGPNRPQEPKPPFPYRSEDVSYENAKAAVKFAGTLTLPSGSGPFPAVLLITGSGPQDRDENIFGHKPFLVIADFLTRRGIAVLRVDDRGVGASTGDLTKATEDDLTDDALAGVAFLRGRADIQPARIGLIGHSEGADVAARSAARSTDVAFIVMLAGTGIPGEELLVSQGEAIMRASGASDEQIERNTEVQRAMFRIVREQQDSAMRRSNCAIC